MALFADFTERLDLPNGPVWPAYGQVGRWLAPPTHVGLAIGDDGLPAFHLSLVRSETPDEGPEPFGLLDLTLETHRDLDQVLEHLRSVVPGATVLRAQLDQSHLGLAWETVSDGAGSAPSLASQWQDSGRTRVIERLDLTSALAMAAQLEANVSPLIFGGAASVLGISPRVSTRVSPLSSLAGAVHSELGNEPFTRDALAFGLLSMGVIDVANASTDVPADQSVQLAEALCDRIIQNWCQSVGRKPNNLPVYEFHDVLEPVDWDLSQPFPVSRWIMLDEMATDPLSDYIDDFGTDRVVTRRAIGKFPKGRHEITAHANLPLNAPSVHMLNVSLLAPANPPDRPSAAHGSGQIDPATGLLTTHLTLALGEPLSFTAECFAVIGEGADIRQVFGSPVESDRQILTLTAQDFGMQVLHHSIDPAILSMADVTLTQSYVLDAAVISTDFVLEGSDLIAVLPIGVEDGTLRLTAREKDGAGEVILEDLPLARLDISLALFETFGRQEVTIQMDPVPTNVIGIDVLPGHSGDDGMQTFAFTSDRSERAYVYAAQSLFAAGFRWRFTGDQDWNLHADPTQTLVVAPPN